MLRLVLFILKLFVFNYTHVWRGMCTSGLRLQRALNPLQQLEILAVWASPCGCWERAFNCWSISLATQSRPRTLTYVRKQDTASQTEVLWNQTHGQRGQLCGDIGGVITSTGVSSRSEGRAVERQKQSGDERRDNQVSCCDLEGLQTKKGEGKIAMYIE